MDDDFKTKYATVMRMYEERGNLLDTMSGEARELRDQLAVAKETAQAYRSMADKLRVELDEAKNQREIKRLAAVPVSSDALGVANKANARLRDIVDELRGELAELRVNYQRMKSGASVELQVMNERQVMTIVQLQNEVGRLECVRDELTERLNLVLAAANGDLGSKATTI
jgi:uncharacterized protein (DUF3084 family)